MSKSVCEEKVFKSVFKTYAGPIINFLYYKTGDYARAEDLMQDAFSKLWENCAKVTFEKAKSFLYTVAKNQFLKQVEHHKVVLKFEKKRHSQRTNESPQFLLEQDEFEKALLGAIEALPTSQKEVFLMNRIEKLKYREIAERLGISVKAVEKRMHKALAELRKITKNV